VIWLAAALAAAPESAFPIETHTLDNGLEVWLQPRDGQAFAALLVVRGGGRYETLESSGASHLLEHMLFTGTERFPDEKELRRFVEERGGSFNGHTYDESVRYRVFLPARYRRDALEWLEQVVYHPLLSQEQLDKEREVVFEERGGRDGWWMRTMHEAGFDQAIWLQAQRLYWPDSMLGVRRIGDDLSLEAMTLERIAAFHEQHYGPENSALVLVGAFEPDQVLVEVEQVFGDLQRGERAPRTELLPELPEQLPGSQRLWDLGIWDQATLGLTCPAVGAEDALYPAADLAAWYLQDLLFDELRTERALVYGVSADIRAWSDAGYLLVSADMDRGKLDQAEAVLLEVMRDHREGGLDRLRLERSRQQAMGLTEIGFEESIDRAHMLGATWLASPSARRMTSLSRWSATPEQVEQVFQGWDRCTTWRQTALLSKAQAWALVGLLALCLVGFGLWRLRR
jgi:predicted Zn-dependent peptidase